MIPSVVNKKLNDARLNYLMNFFCLSSCEHFFPFHLTSNGLLCISFSSAMGLVQLPYMKGKKISNKFFSNHLILCLYKYKRVKIV